MPTLADRETELRDWIQHKDGQTRIRELYKVLCFGDARVAIPSDLPFDGMLAFILSKEFPQSFPRPK